MHICKCGRIHMVDNNKLEKALEQNKNILLVCGGCGKRSCIGADVGPDYYNPNETAYTMYSYDFYSDENKYITEKDFHESSHQKGISEIFFSAGIKVPMMTGMYATDYCNGMFSDRWYPDFYKIQRPDITVDEIMDFINKYTKDRTTVNMKRFINETPDDMLDEISHYMIDGFNWKGTKWETSWNSKDTTDRMNLF